MGITGTAAILADTIEAGTCLPRGAMICPNCDVSWNGFDTTTCWSCGGPGITTAEALAAREATTSTRSE